MKMRDGVELAADVFLPAAPGRYPVLLERTPYLRSRDRNAALGEEWARRGYAFVKQDVRGRGDSAGQYTFLSNDEKDGFDSVEWLAGQEWSNGKVGMIGGSYTAATAWLAARARPPHLLCIVPRAPCGRYFDELPYQGGALLLEWAVRWIPGMLPASANLKRPEKDGLEALYRHRPLLTLDEAMGQTIPLWREVLTHSTQDAYWDRLSFTPEHFRGIEVPSLAFTGWFDLDQPGAIFYWEGMRKHSPARDRQYLVIGPWNHGSTMRGGRPTAGGLKRLAENGGVLAEGDMQFSADAIIDDTAIVTSFLDRYLGQAPAPFARPRASVYVTGSNRWRDLTDYPPPAAVRRSLYLHSAGKANSSAGDGRLDFSPPAPEPSDTFTYDPARPVPLAELTFGMDQQEVEKREDVLVYSTAALDKPLTVLGRVYVNLFAATDGRDTDFTAKLVDVSPDGKAVKLGPKATGVMRARYRDGYDKERLLTPDKTERYRIELFDVGHTFLPGHRVRLEISSSAYPAVAPNANTGNPVATDTETRVARQRIHHGRGTASHIDLPVMPAPGN